MKGLLLKDFYTMSTQAKIFFVMIVIFAVTPGPSTTGFAIVYAGMLPMTALAYDERSKWDALAAMMPYTPRQIVAGKYILGYCGVAAASAIALLAQAAVTTVKGVALGADEVIFVAVIDCVAVFFLSFSLPLMFKLGVERGRIFFFVIIGLSLASVMLLGEGLVAHLQSRSGSLLGLLLTCLGCAILVSLISISLSTRWYQQRER